jgi:hypothetical protein
MRNISDKCCNENENTYFMFNNLFFKLKIDPITKSEWKEYYRKLWNEQDSKGEDGREKERSSKGTDNNEDMITMGELNKVLKQVKNRKSCGLDNLPMKLLEIWRKQIKNAHIRVI